MKGKRSRDVERQEGHKSKQRDAGEGVDQGCCLGDVAGERCCWKQGKTPKLGLFDCKPGGVSCSPFLSLDFIVVVVSDSSSFVCRALLLSRLRRLYRLSLDRQVPLVSSRHIRRTPLVPRLLLVTPDSTSHIVITFETSTLRCF